MSGRGRGRSRRSSYRGSGKRSDSSSTSKQTGKEQVKKNLSDYVYHIGTAKQASDFVVITRYLITISGRLIHMEMILEMLWN